MTNKGNNIYFFSFFLDQFLKKYDDKFQFNAATNWVSLKTYSGAGGEGPTLLQMSESYKSNSTTTQHNKHKESDNR